MKAYELIEILRKAKKPVITTNDIAKFTKGNRKYSSLLANRLVKRGLLQVIEKGKYSLPETPIFAIASNLVFPSYISFLAGLHLNNLTDQIPSSIAVVVTKPRKNLQINQVNIYFVTLPISKFFDYRKDSIDGWPVFVANPEKTVSDCVYLPNYCSPVYLQEAFKSKKINKNKLINLAKFYPHVVLKRLTNLKRMQHDR